MKVYLCVLGKVYSWGRVANGRLGQFSDRGSIPTHAVSKPGIVRGPWTTIPIETNAQVNR